MLNHLSWGQYACTVLLLTIVFYGYIAWRYYRREIRKLLQLGEPQDSVSFSFEEPANETAPAVPATIESDHFEDDGEETFRQIEELVAALKVMLSQAVTDHYTKGELQTALCAVLIKYPQIKNTHFAAAINEMVATECASLGPVDLSEEEVNALWNEVD